LQALAACIEDWASRGLDVVFPDSLRCSTESGSRTRVFAVLSVDALLSGIRLFPPNPPPPATDFALRLCKFSLDGERKKKHSEMRVFLAVFWRSLSRKQIEKGPRAPEAALSGGKWL